MISWEFGFLYTAVAVPVVMPSLPRLGTGAASDSG